MKRTLIPLLAVLVAASCSQKEASWCDSAISTAAIQLKSTAEEIDGTGMLPRSIHKGYDMEELCWQLDKDRIRAQEDAKIGPEQAN